ncbi:hypothetical protein AAFH68_35890 [Flavobacterium sp. CGRL1]
MATNLFEDFNPISSKQWKQKIQFELDGADYNQTVIWNSPEDIQVKPFYHSDEFTKSASVQTQASEFKICQNIFVHDVEKSINRALNTIERGAESLRFTIQNENTDVQKLLENLPLEGRTVYFHLSFLSIDFVKKTGRGFGSKKCDFLLQFRSNRATGTRRKLVYNIR